MEALAVLAAVVFWGWVLTRRSTREDLHRDHPHLKERDA